MKKCLLCILGLLINVVLESVIFVQYIPWGLRPDSVIVVITAMALVIGGFQAGLYGIAAGLVLGILFSPAVGAEALAYFLTAMLLGIFTRKYYADNWIFAGGAAVAAHLIKEILMTVFSVLMGAKTAFFSAFLRYMLPSALLTGLLAIPFFMVYRHLQQDRLRRARYE